MAKLTRSQVIFWDVDTQFDFMRPTGKLYVPGAAKIIPTLKRVSQFIKVHDLQYFATVDVHVKSDPEFAYFPPHCISGTRGMLKIPETSVMSMGIGLHVMKKSSYDIFSEKFMGKVVSDFKSARITTIIVYGVATDYCVKAAALGFIKRGFRVIVIEDAIAGVKPSSSTSAIAEMKAAGIKFLSFDVVAKMFKFMQMPKLADLSKHVDATSLRVMKKGRLRLTVINLKRYGIIVLKLFKRLKLVARVGVTINEEPEAKLAYKMKRNPELDAYIEFVKVQKKYRGRGYASILLKIWTRYFDEHDMATGLEAHPFGDSTIPLANLVAFYKSLGYQLAGDRDDSHAMMYRPRPKPAGTTMTQAVPQTVLARAVAAPSFNKILALAAKAGL